MGHVRTVRRRGRKPGPGAAANLVIADIRARVSRGDLGPGQRLSAERRLAERYGVSRGAVRNALLLLERDRVIETVSPRIRQVCESTAALASRSSLVTAVLADFPNWPGTLDAHGFTSQRLAVGIMAELQGEGLTTLSVPPDWPAEQVLAQLRQLRPRGCVVLGCPARSDLSWLAPAPYVVVADSLPARTVSAAAAPLVAADSRRGAARLTEWLIARGCRRIAMLSARGDVFDDPPFWLAQRQLGYRDACERAGLRPLPQILPPPSSASCHTRATFEERIRVIAGYLAPYMCGEDPLDAVMTYSDGGVTNVAAACRLLGKDPQQDLAIVGYDNYWQLCPERAWEPTAPLATVDKHDAAVGAAAVRRLLHPADFPSDAPTLIEPELVVVD